MGGKDKTHGKCRVRGGDALDDDEPDPGSRAYMATKRRKVQSATSRHRSFFQTESIAQTSRLSICQKSEQLQHSRELEDRGLTPFQWKYVTYVRKLTAVLGNDCDNDALRQRIEARSALRRSQTEVMGRPDVPGSS